MSKRRQLITIDCETDPFKFGRMPQPFIWGKYDGSSFAVYNDIERLCGELQNRDCVVYAHNGGRFDFHFMASQIPVNTDLLVINGRLVSFRIGDAEYRDSYSLIPIPLAAYEKTKIDYSKLESATRAKHMVEITAYLKDDCVNLHNLITDFYEHFGRQSKTLASAAMGQWRKIAGRTTKTRAHFFNTFRKFYHGGRTQALRLGIIKDRFNIFDINSAYPFAMTHEHPYGDDFLCRKDTNNYGQENGFDNCGFYTIDATASGCLCIYQDNKLEFPTARETFSATGWEINAGIETKTLTVHNVLDAYTFSQRINFTPYVDKFYAQKQAAKKNSPAYTFAKLMLNSLYGKFGANPANYWKYKTANVGLFRRLEPDGWQLSGYFGPHILIAKPLTEDEGRYYNIATAASITGFVRAYLWRNMVRAGTVYYCDTDSIVTPGDIDTSANLGRWSLDGRGVYGAIAGRKLYALKLDDSKWKISSKGVRLTAAQIISIAKGGKVTYQQDAPTFSLFKEPGFLSRQVSMIH